MMVVDGGSGQVDSDKTTYKPPLSYTHKFEKQDVRFL